MSEPITATVGHGLPGDEIYHRIREAILRNRLGPGTKLAEVKLSEIFDTNRETVRRALLRLASDSIVEIYPKRGAFVTSPNREQVIHVRDARLALEPNLVVTLAPTITARSLKSLQATAERQRTYQVGGDHGASVEMSGTFHTQLAELGGNPFCQKYLLELTALTCLALVKFEVSPDQGCPIDDHFAIIESLRRKDADEAAMVMSRHVQQVHQVILDNATRPTRRRDLSGLVQDGRTP
ncbi:GntR family transcriptional regulator [Streptomyces solisilvae]|uniref:GntR family transcriptional regulator n=1 Tax=Streptomyces malaysiensis TaxID=92644 RepID=UPI0033339C94